MDKAELTWYTAAMRRGPKPKPPEEHLINVGLKVSREARKELEGIITAESRTEGFLARTFFMRGLDAYRRDQELFKPIQIPDFLRRYLFDFAVLIERPGSEGWEQTLKELIEDLIRHVRENPDALKLLPPSGPESRVGARDPIDAPQKVIHKQLGRRNRDKKREAS